MTIRDILVPLGPSVDFEPQFDAAAHLARALNAQVNVVFTRPDAVMAMAGVSDMLTAAGIAVDTIEHETLIAETSAIDQFPHWRKANGLTTGAVWHERIGEIADTITDVGRVSDLIVIGKPDPYEAGSEDMFHTAIHATGRPAMIVPGRQADNPLDHVLIAWNGSLEAVHAVAGAMPMLEAAGRVSIFTMQENPHALHRHLGLIEHLDHHGIPAGWAIPSSHSGDVGLCLTQTASREGATMIVMGAYTHHRVHQFLLGGVTRHMLAHAEIPVVMMH